MACDSGSLRQRHLFPWQPLLSELADATSRPPGTHACVRLGTVFSPHGVICSGSSAVTLSQQHTSKGPWAHYGGRRVRSLGFVSNWQEEYDGVSSTLQPSEVKSSPKGGAVHPPPRDNRRVFIHPHSLRTVIKNIYMVSVGKY